MDITNLDTYNARMASSIEDKMWFWDKVKYTTNTIVDYGCADASLLLHINEEHPYQTLIGYDASDDMLARAKEKTKDTPICFVESIFEPDMKDTCLVLSSVVHEIYSYQSEEDADFELGMIFDLGAKYIAIRDMGIRDICRNIETPIDILKSIYARDDVAKIASFEKRQGRISNWANCIHYLLKAPYDENWAREVEENYVPFTMNEVLAQYNVDSPVKYDVVYFEAYTLPYVRERIIRDYNISLYAPTHYKLLLERRF